MALKITSDNKWRGFVYAKDVPAKVMQGQFDYLDPEEAIDGFSVPARHAVTGWGGRQGLRGGMDLPRKDTRK